MRGIFTADFQCEWGNISLCTQAWTQMVRYARVHNLGFICIAGDLKRAYNPVDARVVMWWQRAISRAKKRNLRVIVANGNHDRIGQSDDQQNWLPILRRAGAEVFDEPGWVEFNDLFLGGGRLAVFPFCTSTVERKKWSAGLAKQARESDVLVFHGDLRYASYNVTGAKSDTDFSVGDLHPAKYRACIGGHIHLAQKLDEDVYYVGSPFATDWGEANQKKSFMVVTDDEIEIIPSGIPGWYDQSWPGFPKRLDSWEGTNLRIHVPVSSGADYGAILSRSREAAEAKYPGAIVHVVAEFEEKEQVKNTVKISDPDRVKVNEYVRQSKFEQEKQMVEYLMTQLERVGGTQRVVSTVRFMSSSAKNFLSFKEVQLKFQPGLTLVQGVNRDRNGCSNGSGKTSLMNILPVAFFGTTFKGQKYDAWARRGTEEQAEVEVLFKDARQRTVRVTRSRRPVGIGLSIEGVDHSSGLRGDAKDATAGLIEQVGGFTWHTLANSIFIDQEITRAFLAGTKKQRTEVLSRFQNLERFEAALKWVRQDKKQNYERRVETESELHIAESSVRDLKVECEQLEQQHKRDLKELKDGLRKIEQQLDEANIQLEHNSGVREKKKKKLESQMTSLNSVLSALDKELGELRFERKEIEDWAALSGQLHKDATCPTCYQKLDHKLLAKMVKKWMARLEEITQSASEKQISRGKLMKDQMLLERQVEDLDGKTLDEKQTVRMLETSRQFEHKQLVAFHNASVREGNQRKQKRKALKKAERVVQVQKHFLQRLKEDEQFYAFAEQAMGRDGIPAFLNRALVPVLNKAAEYYSELFAAKAIQVRFEVVDSEFEVRVMNATGGEDFDAQSSGERALAGMIASFALRETAPKSNLLVLDEPGEGLDAVNARKFAAGLKQLVKKFECVYLTTHNPAIIGELSGERVVTVVKKNGISQIKRLESGNQKTV